MSVSSLLIEPEKSWPLDLTKLIQTAPASADPEGFEPLQLSRIQSCNPLFALFGASEPNIGLTQTMEMVDYETVRNRRSGHEYRRPVFIKFSPLLDPLDYMIGKYDGRPEMQKNFGEEGTKYANPNNCSYVDGFFCYLSGRLLNEWGVVGAIDFYGSWLAMQGQFKMNVYDDLHYLNEFPVFFKKMESGEVHCTQFHSFDNGETCSREGGGTRAFRPKKRLITADIEEILLDDVEEIVAGDGGTADDDVKQDIEEIYVREMDHESGEPDEPEEEDESEEPEEEDEEEEESDTNEEEEDEQYEDLESEESEEGEIFAYIRDFPVQLICMEKCDGSLDDLFETETVSCDQSMAWMAQIVLTLIAFQKAFSLTHNDLHTNNILYKNTEVETLYYRFGGKVWAIPTYGRILKIIDFGRAIYRLGDKKMTSDCFSTKGDAYSQYNVEPYFDRTKPRVEENPSFDLCRLACSMFEYVLEGTTSRRPREMDRFQTLIWAWCLDDNGRSILYKKNGDERFPNFDLYKMIARTVHGCVPEKQMDTHFAEFEFKGGHLPENYPCIDLDALPVFYLPV